MKIQKIHDKLYRVHNNGKVKDAWIRDGEIMRPITLYDRLTDLERQAVQKELPEIKDNG